MRFVTFDEVRDRLFGKTVAIVGSAPSCLDNEPGFIDSHDVVVRVNNYRTGEAQGRRTDVYYSYFGGAIKKTAQELQADGVTLCLCKCPNSQPIDCEWHRQHNRMNGIDFRYIYEMRKDWFFCDTYVPDDSEFLQKFELLSKHIPTTGFSAIVDIVKCEIESANLFGFDFFSSGVHNVNEPWRAGDPEDPIGHRPELESAWLAENAYRYPITMDAKLAAMLSMEAVTS